MRSLNETARVHNAARQRGGCVAARSARAAFRAYAADRRTCAAVGRARRQASEIRDVDLGTSRGQSRLSHARPTGGIISTRAEQHRLRARLCLEIARSLSPGTKHLVDRATLIDMAQTWLRLHKRKAKRQLAADPLNDPRQSFNNKPKGE